LRGIAGEPLKVVLLAPDVDSRQATAAVALERVAYTVGTTIIVGVASIAAIAMLPLSTVWFRVFRDFAILGAMLACLPVFAILGKGTYLLAGLRGLDRVFNARLSQGATARRAGDVE